MTAWSRAPHAGWYVVLTLALCILAVCWAAFAGRRAMAQTDRANRTLDSLARFRCVPLDSGDVIIRRKVGG